MAGSNKVIGAPIAITVGGKKLMAKGDFTYVLGTPTKKEVMGADMQVAGIVYEGKAPYIEGAITETYDTDLEELFAVEDATVVLSLGNRKKFVLSNAFESGSHEGKTSESEVNIKFTGFSAKIVK